MGSRFTRLLLAGSVVAAGTWFCVFKPLQAQTEGTGSFREACAPGPQQAGPQIKLNYLGATWDRVLKDLSEQLGRELVMDQVPPGRLTRHDRRSYTPAEAVRLLNAELQKKGYRLLPQRQHLVVLHLDAARSRYARPVPVVSEPATTEPQREDSASSLKPTASLERADHVIRSRTAPQSVRPIGATPQDFEAIDAQPIGARPIEARPFAQQPPAADVGPLVKQTVKIVNGQAADVARSIFEVFSSRSTLNRKGLDGLPSFTVFQRGPNGARSERRHFEVAIDRGRNALTIAAPRSSIAQLVDLIRDLDQAPAGQQDVRVVQTHNLKARTTQELQEELNRLTKGRARTAFRPDNEFFAQDENRIPRPASSSPRQRRASSDQ